MKAITVNGKMATYKEIPPEKLKGPDWQGWEVKVDDDEDTLTINKQWVIVSTSFIRKHKDVVMEIIGQRST